MTGARELVPLQGENYWRIRIWPQWAVPMPWPPIGSLGSHGSLYWSLSSISDRWELGGRIPAHWKLKWGWLRTRTRTRSPEAFWDGQSGVDGSHGGWDSQLYRRTGYWWVEWDSDMYLFFTSLLNEFLILVKSGLFDPVPCPVQTAGLWCSVLLVQIWVVHCVNHFTYSLSQVG